MSERGAGSTLVGIIALAVVAAAGIGAWWWLGPRARAEARERAGGELARLERCLLGRRGLDAETGRRRLRQLALRYAFEEEPGWPSRCEAHAEALRAALATLEDAPYRALAEAAALDAALAPAPMLLTSPPDGPPYEELGRLLAAANAAQLPGGDVEGDGGDVEAADAPPFPELTVRGAGDRVFVERTGAPSFVVHGDNAAEARPAVACRLTSEGLRCDDAGEVARGGQLRAVPRADATAPLVLTDLAADADAEIAMRAPDGTPRGDRLHRAVALADGTLAGVRLRSVGDPLSVVRAPDGAAHQAPLAAPRPGLRISDAIVGPGIVALHWTATGKSVLAVHPMDPSGDLGPPTEVEANGTLGAACRLGDTLAVAWTPSAAGTRIDFVTESGAVQQTAPAAPGRTFFACLADAVSVAHVAPADDALAVAVRRCRPTGCDAGTGAVPLRPPFEGATGVAADLGDRVLVALAPAPEGPVVSVVAPIAALATATPRVLADTVAFGGPRIDEILLLARADGAALIVRGGGAVRSLSLGPDGAPR